MTSVVDRAAQRRYLGAAVRLLPGVAAVLFGAVVLVQSGTPATAILRYGMGFVWEVIVPGVLLYRALSGPSRQLAVELGAGTVVGLIFQLLGWLAFVGLGIGSWIALWPLVAVVPFALVPALRRHLRPTAYAERMHPVAAWGLAGTFMLMTIWFTALFNRTQLPPAASQWYQDEYYHLSLSGMFLHQVVPMTPQVAGLPLVYHWFSNAHMAAMALGSGEEMPVVLTRLFVLPIVAATLFMFVALLHELTSSAWPAVIAAALTTMGGGIRVARWYGLPGTEPFAIHSPSQNYSLPFLLFALLLLARLLKRGRLGRGEWVLLGAALLAAPGTKSSSLPLLVCGLALALLVGLLRREGRRAGLLALLAAVGALAVTTPVLGGGSAGTGIQLFSTVRRNGLWVNYVGLSWPEQVFPTGHVIPGIAQDGALALLALIVLGYAVQYAWLLPGALVLGRRHGTAGWLLLGVGVAGWAAMMLIDHDGMSQVYFMNQALVAWHVLAAWGTWELVVRARRHLPAAALAGIAVVLAPLGWGGVVLLAEYGPSRPQPPQYLATMAVPLLVVTLALLGGVLVAYVLTRTGHRSWAAGVAVALVAGLLSAAVLPHLESRLNRTHPGVVGEGHVTAAETAAAQWLRDNTPPLQVVATNVHCVGIDQGPHCDARSFWVGGFAERPVLIEGWGYTDAAHLAHGRDGYRYSNQPFNDQELYELNQAAFTRPSEQGMAELAAHDVEWLFADLHRGPVSPDMGRYADEVWRNEDVVIYRMR